MPQNLSKLEQGISDLVKIGTGTSLVSFATAPLWDNDFKYTIASTFVTCVVAGIGLLARLYNKADETPLDLELNYRNFEK